MTISAEETVIPPTRAAQLLEHNTINRNLRPGYVNQLANEMANGYWKMNGESIIISDQQDVLDGQHRLEACVRSGVPLRTLLVVGVPRSVFETIDIGRGRTIYDILSINATPQENGIKYRAEIASAARLLLAYQTHRLTNAMRRFTTREIIEAVREHPGLAESCAKWTMPRGINRAVFSCLHYLFADINKEAADKFMEDLCRGGGDPDAGDPVWTLRERLLHGTWPDNKLDASMAKFRAGIRAWNARREGRRMFRAMTVPRGHDSSAAPEIVR